MRQNGKFLKHTKTEGKTEVAQTAQEAVEESKSKCCGGRTDPATRAATAAAARFGRLEAANPRRSWARHTFFLVGRKRLPARLSPAPIAPASGGQDSRQKPASPLPSAAAGLTTTADDQIKEMPSS